LRLLLNLIWLVFGGLVLALAHLITGVLMSVLMSVTNRRPPTSRSPGDG
jgi:uncharacterized membrane protein YccF (DUF307 family)